MAYDIYTLSKINVQRRFFMNIIRKEIYARNKIYNDEHNVIGAELRQQRIKQSKTLDSTVADICSLSYLCKIERNSIRPNKKIIHDVCVRLNLEKDDVDVLLNLKDLVYKSVSAYLYKNVKGLKEAEEKTRCFDNYRSKIIALVKSICDKNFDKAMELDFEILKLASTMNKFDLSVFYVFHAILCYYRQAFVEACDNLSSIIELFDLPKELQILSYMYLMKAEVKSNNHNINYTYINVKNILINYGEYSLLDEINYYICLYFLKNKMYKNYSKYFKSINNKTYRNTLLIFVKLIFNPKQSINEKYYKDCRRSANLLVHYYKNEDLFYMIADNISDSDFDVDFNPLFFQYLTIKTDKERFDFIVEIASKALELSYDCFVAQYLLDELSRLSYIHSKYKVFQAVYERFRKLQ